MYGLRGEVDENETGVIMGKAIILDGEGLGVDVYDVTLAFSLME